MNKRIMKYNKLVRDQIPEIIRGKGKKPVTAVAKDNEYYVRLKKKLEEEVYEFFQSNNSEELADILEVVYAIAKTRGISVDNLEKIRIRKRTERGGFEKRLVLYEVK